MKHSVELGEIGIDHHLPAPDLVDAALDERNGDGDEFTAGRAGIWHAHAPPPFLWWWPRKTAFLNAGNSLSVCLA